MSTYTTNDSIRANPLSANVAPGAMRYNYEKGQLEWFSGAGWDAVVSPLPLDYTVSPGSMVYLHGRRSDLLMAEGQAIRNTLSKIKEEHPDARVDCPHPEGYRSTRISPWLFGSLELFLCDACLDALFMTGDKDKWR